MQCLIVKKSVLEIINICKDSSNLTGKWDVENTSKWVQKKFADLPNEIYKSITGIDFHSLSRIDKEKEREEFISFCEHLKLWDTDVWVNSLMKDYNPVTFDYKGSINKEIIGDWVYPNWIITDLRFPNEYKAVQKRNGLHIHLERFEVGDLVNWENSGNNAEYEIFECYKDYALIGITGMGNREPEYEIKVLYSELSLVKNDTHKSENTDLLKESFDENVIYLYNVGTVEELIEKVKLILINNKIIELL